MAKRDYYTPREQEEFVHQIQRDRLAIGLTATPDSMRGDLYHVRRLLERIAELEQALGASDG